MLEIAVNVIAKKIVIAIGGSMSRSRIQSIIQLSALAGASTIGFFASQSPKQHPQHRVNMAATSNSESSPSTLERFSFLTSQLAKDSRTPAIFQVALTHQRYKLTNNEVVTLATLAIENQHVRQLDTLAGYFPDVITRDWVNQALKQANNSQLYSRLLRKGYAGKLKNLGYLFDHTNDVVLIEQSDLSALNRARASGNKSLIIAINSDPYEPAYRRLT